MEHFPKFQQSSTLVPEIRRNGRIQYLNVHYLPPDDLFENLERFLVASDSQKATKVFENHSDPIAVVEISPTLFISLRHAKCHPTLIQCFVAALFSQASQEKISKGNKLQSTTIDPENELTVWTFAGRRCHHIAAEIWNEIKTEGRSESLDSLTTPSIYGSKLRMVGTLCGVATAKLPAGAPILDMMSGTGIVTRSFARRHPVSSNDANPYAALLTHVQSITFGSAGQREAEKLLDILRPPSLRHASKLREKYANTLATEEIFLHRELNNASMKEYKSFIAETVPSIVARGNPEEGDLITARYANAYFGVGQSIEIDAIRFAIEIAIDNNDPRRDLCLAALVLTACTCNTGPHFAQPQPINSEAAFRYVIERRARSALWEFEVALRRLASREPLSYHAGPVTCGDWRIALHAFAGQTSTSKVRAVYIDPPYSKLQYSRYYHVLNVLLANDYPPIFGKGRYPPLEDRFSSKFEFQPTSATREFEEVIGRCANYGMHLLISYGGRGFVPVESLVTLMSTHYRNVDVFSEKIQHHSQGVALSSSDKGQVTEYVIVGS